MRQKIILALLLFGLLAPLPGSQLPMAPPDRSGVMRIVPVPAASIGQRIGALTLAEAWDLDSRDDRVGGISGMTLTGGRTFLMVTDTGQRLQFGMTASGEVRNFRLTELPSLGRGLERKRYLDAEAVTRDPRTGVYWVALEGIAQIWRFTPEDKRSARFRQPVMYKWPANGGPESLALLPGQRFIALSERSFRGELSEGVMISGDPALPTSPNFRFDYDSRGLGAPTDVAALPDGRILILHRKLGLRPIFTASIALADPRGLKSGARLTSTPIAVINDLGLTENFEGAAIEQDSSGLSLWLVSDNNQNDWQRSRLLRFKIDPAALEESSPKPKQGSAKGAEP